MTMLDRMRRHRNWLKWSLGLVVLAFVIFYIPDFLSGTGTDAAGSSDTVATIDGREITAGEFRRTYLAQLQTYRNAYGSSLSEQMLKQLGVEQQILQQMVDEKAAAIEAGRLGIAASDGEVRQRILTMPAFQDKAGFIGEQRYRQLLRTQSPPMSPFDFEESVRRQLAIEKLRSSISSWLSVPDTELEQAYRRKNDKVKLAVVGFADDRFRAQVTATDPEVAAYFESHKSDFEIPEKRKIRYLLVDVDLLRNSVSVPPADVERTYNDNAEQYSTPEQIRASHILLKTEGGQEDTAVKARAEEVLEQAKAGADFSELARKFSEDEASATNGGDLDYFGRGRMVPEFDQAAFALEAGQISHLVKSQYGYHIIKVVDKKPSSTRPLADVRQQIIDQLASERAQARAATVAEKIEKEISKPTDLDKVGKGRGISVHESEFFARDEPVIGLGSSLEAASRAFGMKVGEVSGPIRTSRGIAFETVLATQDPYVPKLDEVKARVHEEVIKKKARVLGKQRAAEIAAKLKVAPAFETAASAAGFEAKTTELIARDSPISDLGVAPAVDEAAFALPVEAVSDPIATDAGTAVIKVLEKKEVTPEEWALSKDRFREELLNERRDRLFGAYMSKAKQRMKIDINRENFQRAIG